MFRPKTNQKSQAMVLFSAEVINQAISFYFIFDKVPNVSFTVYAPGFLSRFIESHAVMFQGNAGLKPKEGEVTSRPWQWPINYRVSFCCCCARNLRAQLFRSDKK